MSAKPSDLARIQTILDVMRLTETQIEELGFDRARFLQPSTTEELLSPKG